VLDVGAHAGQFAKLFARMAPGGRVYAFEPSEYARSILTRALAFNRVGNVTVVPCGLSDVPARAVLHTPLKRSSAWGFGTAHLGGEASAAEADQTVALERLDDFAKRQGRALKGGEGTLRAFRPVLYLEVDDAHMTRAGDTPQALFAWLAELGYRAFETPSLEPAPTWRGTGDYLFLPDERA